VPCSRFTRTQQNEDAEEAITLCQDSLAALPSLHRDRYFSHMWLQEAYLSRYQILHNPADLLLTRELQTYIKAPYSGLSIPHYNSPIAENSHAFALEAYHMCFEL
jgi:hypothetical protein